MSQQAHGNKVQQDLARAVTAGVLPAEAQGRAEKLLARLEQPVRIGVMGLPKAGKSTVLNLLVGADVAPEGVTLPTLQLTYGAQEQTVCTLSDGSKTTLPHANPAEIAALEPVFVDMQLPLAALRKISVLEVVAPEDQRAMHRASQWAAKRCDVALWCSEGFNANEQALWAAMPDVIKDHAFLLLTKSDLQDAAGTLPQTLSAAHRVATDEFNKILPIATLNAIAARQEDGSVDKDRMRESGGLALIQAVLKQVQMGRQSSIDMAEILLHQHADQLADLADTPEAALAEEAPQPAPTTAPEAPAEAAPAPAPAAASNVVTLQPATRDAYEHVLAYIADQAQALVTLVEKLGDAAPAKIMAKAVEHVQWLSDDLNEHGDDSDPAMIRVRDMAMDAADLVQLMQMEKRDSAAVEALSLMIQIKHELQAELAA